ncbi:MAG: 2-amino-4-hydroxy-6-hydroxymethyldihydropteridine diphosphokinase [Acetobacteraceae bacterium]
MILVGIGANLPGPDGAPPLQTARWAAQRLGGIDGLRMVALSCWYESEPVPPSGQPPYVNGVARLEGSAEPAALLFVLQAIEAEAGRVRSVPNAARPLDLDLVAMGLAGAMVRRAPDPVLPHPRAHLRAFVLLPLLDVAPEWTHPVVGRTARDLLAALPPQAIRRISSAGP